MATKAQIKPEKKERVKALAEEMKGAESVTFVDYSGMSVKLQQALKAKLRETGGKMLVAKNTLLKIAGKEAKMADEALGDELLSGQTAMIIASDDAISPIQALGKYIEENEVPQFRGGIVEGVFQDKENLIKISKLPGRDELLAQVAGTLTGLGQRLVGTLESKTQELVFVLEQGKTGR
jgi:large subunit ribosomal protein L10